MIDNGTVWEFSSRVLGKMRVWERISVVGCIYVVTVAIFDQSGPKVGLRPL